MRNAGLEEAQAGIKIAGRNINNLRYADDTTFMAESEWSESEMKSLSRVRLFATPWTAAYQAPPSMGFSRQEYRSGLPFPSPVYALGWPKHDFMNFDVISVFKLLKSFCCEYRA